MYMLLLKIRGMEKLRRVDPESSSQGEFLPLFFFSSFCSIYDLYVYMIYCHSTGHVNQAIMSFALTYTVMYVNYFLLKLGKKFEGST